MAPGGTAVVHKSFRTVVDVMLILVDGDRVLLALREGTGYADGLWNLPSGKLKAEEDVVGALIRESREEVSLCIGRDEVRIVVVLHRRNPGGEARIGFFFEVASDPGCQGVPVNAEPGKWVGSHGSPWTSSRLRRCRTRPLAWISTVAASASACTGWDAPMEESSSRQEWGRADRSPREWRVPPT
jgi:ADP-ribose pyrophosphatase YjhB (NUDIX family)